MDLHLHVQSVSIITDAVRSIPYITRYSIQLYVMQFVTDSHQKIPKNWPQNVVFTRLCKFSYKQLHFTFTSWKSFLWKYWAFCLHDILYFPCRNSEIINEGFLTTWLIQWKTKITSVSVNKSNRRIVERGTTDTSTTQIYDCSPSCLDADTSIKGWRGSSSVLA